MVIRVLPTSRGHGYLPTSVVYGKKSWQACPTVILSVAKNLR